MAHVLKNITDTSYLIGDGTGRGSANSNYFVFESDEYQRHFMPYTHDTQHHQTSTLTTLIISRALMMFSMLSMITQNKFKKLCSCLVMIHIFVKSHLMQIFTTIGFKDSDDFMAYDVVRTTNGSAFK